MASGYQPGVYRRRGGNELVVASGGKIIIEDGGEVSVAVGGDVDFEGDLLTLKSNAESIVHHLRMRVSAAEVNAGHTLLPAIEGYKYRMVDCALTAIGGAAGGTTGVDVIGTLTDPRKLLAVAVAALGENALVRAGATNAAILAAGASFVANDANTAITIIKDGNNLTTATHIDVLLSYVIEEA